MNIAVLTASRATFYFKPDTSLERDVTKDYYVPGFICSPSAVPVVFIKIDRPCKSVSPDFTGRYYSCFSYGVLLDGKSKRGMVICQEGSATALDYSSILPLLTRSIESLDSDDARLYFKCGNEKSDFKPVPGVSRAVIDKALISVTKYCTLRSGDILALSLTDPKGIRRGYRISGKAFGETIFDFKVK